MGAPPTKAFTDDYLLTLLARASHMASAQFHARLRPVGLDVPTWRVLGALSDGRGLTIGTLAKLALYKQPSLTKVINRMERDGLVERRKGVSDRREVAVHITAKGLALVRPLLREAKDHEAQILASHSDEEQTRLKDVLRTLIDRLEAAGPLPGEDED